MKWACSSSSNWTRSVTHPASGAAFAFPAGEAFRHDLSSSASFSSRRSVTSYRGLEFRSSSVEDFQ
jgi:hypothetical protein